MTIGVTAFPTAVDTADTLVRVSNLAVATSVTDNPLLVGATTVNVSSTTNYAASGTITIEGEVITYTGTTGTSFTGCTRGADGTTAASHALGAAVQALFTALHHTVLRDAIIAVETKIGGGASVPASNQVLAGTGAGTAAWTGTPTVASITTTTANTGGIVQEAWTAPTLLNSWINLGAGHQVAGYFRDSAGLVHIRGTVKSGVIGAGTPMWTLPSGYRASATELFGVASNDAFGEIRTDSAGQVYAFAGSNAFFQLNGTTFDTR